jgi:hypothetical protein
MSFWKSFDVLLHLASHLAPADSTYVSFAEPKRKKWISNIHYSSTEQ